MNGYRRGYYPQIQSNNPWHNPYMKYPDIAGGARDIRNTLMQVWQMKQAQQQQEWERKVEEERLGIERQRAEAYGESIKPRPGKTIDQIRAEAEARAKGAGTGKFAPERKKPSTAETPEQRQFRQQIKRDTNKVDTVIERYSGERERLISVFEKMGTMETPTPRQAKQRADVSQQIRHIDFILDKLNGVRGGLSSGTLNEVGNQFINAIMGSMNELKKGNFAVLFPQDVQNYWQENPQLTLDQIINLYLQYTQQKK